MKFKKLVNEINENYKGTINIMRSFIKCRQIF